MQIVGSKRQSSRFSRRQGPDTIEALHFPGLEEIQGFGTPPGSPLLVYPLHANFCPQEAGTRLTGAFLTIGAAALPDIFSLLAQAHLAAEEEASHKRRLKKKSKSGLVSSLFLRSSSRSGSFRLLNHELCHQDFLDDEMELPGVKKQQHLVSMASLGAAAGRPPRPGSGPVPPIHQAGSSLPAGMSAVGAMGAGLVRSGSVVRGDVVLKDGILEAGHKRKTDKKRKKGDIMDGDLATTHAAAATDLLDADGQGLKRLGPGMETPGSARGGLERRPPKKSKVPILPSLVPSG